MIADPPYAHHSAVVTADLERFIAAAVGRGLNQQCHQQSALRDDWNGPAMLQCFGDTLLLLPDLGAPVNPEPSQVLFHDPGSDAYVLLDGRKLTVFAGSDAAASTLLAELVERFGRTTG